MDPIIFGGAYMTWLFSFLAGGVTTLGLVMVITGRMVFGLGYSDWSPREARQLGTICVVCGLAYGLYTLYIGLSLETHQLPLFWIGYWWGIVLPDIPGAVLFVGVLLQVAIVRRHRRLAARHEPRR